MRLNGLVLVPLVILEDLPNNKQNSNKRLIYLSIIKTLIVKIRANIVTTECDES